MTFKLMCVAGVSAACFIGIVAAESIAPDSQTTSGLMNVANTVTDLMEFFTEYLRTIFIGIPVLDILAKDKTKFGQYVATAWMISIPTMLAFLGHFQMPIQAYMRRKLARARREYVRDLDDIRSSDYYFNLRRDNKNGILHKAITLYLGRQRDVAHIDGLFRLMQDQNKEYEDWDDRFKVTRSAKELQKMVVATLPQEREWTQIEPGLFFTHYQENIDGSIGETRTKHTMSFRTYASNGDTVIDKFVNKCYSEYIARLKAEEDKARYLYQMQLGIKPKTEDDSGSVPPVFKKYKLSDERTFESLFFPEKEEILRLVEDFEGNKGKFAIEGFPKKLGLLLYGPPGTGKTSFVKALATHTNRHIVTVPLGKITTNQELYDIMFERVFPCLGDDGVAQQLAFNEVIFLMEEVDAATDIVKTRKTKDKQKSTEAVQQSKAFEADCAEDEEEGMGEAGMLADLKESAALSAAGFDTLGDLAGPVSLKASEYLYESPDKLDLAGLLNILDGVVDSPGRIVIMTTNHPEKLDAALIRPGRINRQLHFTYMIEAEMVKMLVHHYAEPEGKSSLTVDQRNRLSTVLKNKTNDFEGEFSITPAEIEQLCAENDTFDDFIADLTEFGKHTEEFDLNKY